MLKAIIFDLDGTLVHTDPIHYQIWEDILKNYGMDIDLPFYKKNISGGTNEAILNKLLPQLSDSEVTELAYDKEARFRENALDLQPLNGLLEFLKWIEDSQLKKGVVTNAPPENVEFMLKEALKLADRFNPIILAGVMTAAKPDPASYKLCLSELGISAKEAIVFEDSPSGIKAAVAAEIYTVGVASTHEPEALKALGAAEVIVDFSDEKLWEIIDRYD